MKTGLSSHITVLLAVCISILSVPLVVGSAPSTYDNRFTLGSSSEQPSIVVGSDSSSVYTLGMNAQVAESREEVRQLVYGLFESGAVSLRVVYVDWQ